MDTDSSSIDRGINRGDRYFRRPAYPTGASLDVTHYVDVTDEVAALRAERDFDRKQAADAIADRDRVYDAWRATEAEVELMRPLLEAAGTYVAAGAFSQYTRTQAEDMLRDAVDAYRAASSEQEAPCPCTTHYGITTHTAACKSSEQETSDHVDHDLRLGWRKASDHA